MALLLAALPHAAAAQETIHWPLRTQAGAEALAEGAAAAFWNPAGMAATPGRGSGLVVDSRSPSQIGLSGFALAVSYAALPDLHLGAGLRHVGIGGIDRTTDSPLPDPGGDALDASEDRFHAGFAWSPRSDLSVGAGIRYARVSELLGGDAQVGAAVGARWAPAVPLRPVLAVTAGSERGEAAWAAGVRVSAPLPADLEDWALHGEYGVRHAPAVHDRLHRVVATVAWRRHATLSFGTAVEPDGVGSDWHPVAAGSVSLGRYTVGLVREGLAGGFGTAHTFRLNVDF